MPTYRGSVPVYSSTTKNWFQTQPRFTRPAPSAPSCGAPGARGAGEPAAHRRPGGGGSNSSSSSAAHGAAPAGPLPSGRGLMLGLRWGSGAWTSGGTRESQLRWHRQAAPRHMVASARPPGRRPPTGRPDWRGRGRGRTPGMDVPRGPARAPLEPGKQDHQAMPPQLRSLVRAMVPGQRGAGWGPQIQGSLED